MYSLKDTFKHYRGQPVEVIMHGFRVVGIVVECYESYAKLFDRAGRIVDVRYCEIEAVIEPQMRLKRVFGDDDAGFDCYRDYDRYDRCRERGCGCDNVTTFDYGCERDCDCDYNCGCDR